MYQNQETWFIEEVNNYTNQTRVSQVIELREYLSGLHAIMQRPAEMYNGKEFEPRKIVLQYAKTIINFATSYLLSKPITISGTKNVVNQFKKVYKKGKYNRLDFNILDRMIKYGRVAEYVYLDGNKEIKSKLINPEDSYPVYSIDNEYIAFIESYTGIDSISYYNVYYADRVEKWTNENGNTNHIGTFNNVSGLPIIYHNQNELDDTDGRSDLLDIINVLDNMEDLLSKATDAYYKHIIGIPVVTGQQLKGDGLPSEIIGGGLNLDDGSTFDFKSNQFDYKAFETLYKTLVQSLLDVSSTPAVSMNRTDISNLSEVSIKLLFQLADIKASLNEQYIREGIEQRFDKIRELLELKGINISDKDYDTLDVVFSYARPMNDKEIIDNLNVLNNMGAISLESVLERSPYTVDVVQELERLANDVGNSRKSNE